MKKFLALFRSGFNAYINILAGLSPTGTIPMGI